MEHALENQYTFIDLYDHVVNGHLVDAAFTYDSWSGQYAVEDSERRIFNLKVKGYFSED